jgi:hypothetical protein
MVRWPVFPGTFQIYETEKNMDAPYLRILSNPVTISLLPHPIWQQRGGVKPMELLINFLVSVAAGILCYYICKWLDRHGKGQ